MCLLWCMNHEIICFLLLWSDMHICTHINEPNILTFLYSMNHGFRVSHTCIPMYAFFQRSLWMFVDELVVLEIGIYLILRNSYVMLPSLVALVLRLHTCIHVCKYMYICMHVLIHLYICKIWYSYVTHSCIKNIFFWTFHHYK